MAYEVALPEGMRAHNVFHPWLLHRVDVVPLPSQPQDEEGHVELADPDIDDDTDYDVEAVLDSRMNKRMLQYLVKWAEYPEGPDNPSWEPYMNVIDSADLVMAFHKQRPDKPGPHKKFSTLTGKQDLVIMTLQERDSHEATT
jgi:hypothetical protein